MKEKLQEYALVAEIVGAIAIVVSLLFVGIQLRQSNTIAATDAIKDGTQIWTTAYGQLFGSKATTAFFRMAINHCEQLSPDEQGEFFSKLGYLIAGYDNIYNQYQSGRLTEEHFVSIASNYFGIVNMPCAQKTMTKDFMALPPWMLDWSTVDVLAGRENDLRLPTFLVE